MPPRISRTSIGIPTINKASRRLQSPAICLFCSHTQAAHDRTASKPRRNIHLPRRAASTLTNGPTNAPTGISKPTTPRVELQDALLNVQKHARRFVNLSRLQLALHGLQQAPGNEAIRIAVLGLADGGQSLKSARELLRLLLADPLKTEEEWEGILLEAKRQGKPLLLRVGHNDAGETSNSGGWLVQELKVSSPPLNGHNLELLVLEMEPSQAQSQEEFAENVLVPTMEIPTSNTGRYTPITTPVHKALIVGEGLGGAASLLGYPARLDSDLIGMAANIQLAKKDDSTPLQVIDITQGSNALQMFRQSIDNALAYERQWFQSGLPELVEWIKVGTTPTDAGMKEPVRKLIESLLERTIFAVQAEEAARLATTLSSHVSGQDIASLQGKLSQWSEGAHTELRDQLDEAFDSNRWRKLSWWKLFWRVDDVSMFASDILAKQFLTMADKEIIFLAGAIAQARPNEKPSYHETAQPIVQDSGSVFGGLPPPPNLYNLLEPRDRVALNHHVKRWPIQIDVTRNYLLLDTVPALQALAQKLVLQTLTTSSFASAAAGLMYISTISTSLYEAGAVAALGIVWSMRRMQGKWEAARRFWEGEVREEGRKAVKSVEFTVREALKDTSKATVEVDEELEVAKDAVQKAQAALEKCK